MAHVLPTLAGFASQRPHSNLLCTADKGACGHHGRAARRPLTTRHRAWHHRIYLNMGDFEQAIVYFERTLEVNPNPGGAFATLRLLRRQLQQKRDRAI